jgi:hypothetical protein
MDPKIKAAIAAIPASAWTPIRYSRGIWDDQLRAWISDAEVAEVEYTAFTSKNNQAIRARLIVRRVKDLNRTAGQDELFPVWCYHAIFTDSPFELSRPRPTTATTPSWSRCSPTASTGRWRTCHRGCSQRNAAWLALAAVSHNLLRAAGALAGLAYAKARGATLRRDLINIAARIARHGRGQITVHLPEGWHREHDWMNLFDAACGPPAAAA